MVTLSSLGLLIYYPLCFYGVFPEEHLDYHALFMTLAALGLSEFAKLRNGNHYIQGETQNALTILENLRVLSATRCSQNDNVDVLTTMLKVGDKVYVARDAVIPVDGRLQTGTDILDGTLICGKSKPQFMQQDALAYAGTLSSR